MPLKKLSSALEMNPDLDVFSSPSIQTTIAGEQLLEIFPVSSLAANQPIQFDVPETFSQMTDPNFLLIVKVKITLKDGKSLPKDAKVAGQNLMLHALFKSITLKANGTILTQATGTYPYRAYIETNYSYSSAAKDGAIGIPQMYYQETTGKFNTLELNQNTSFDKRVKKFAESTVVEMAGRLHIDILMQPKFIIPGVKFSLTLIPSSSEFCILSGTESASEIYTITSAVLKVRRVNLHPATLLTLERALQVKPAQYPISRAVVRTTEMIAGQMSLSNFLVYNGQLPRLAIITLVDSISFNGHYIRNPFNFSLKNCASAQMEVNGRLYPPLPFNIKKTWIEPYLNSLKVVNKLYADSSSGLTLDDFLDAGHQILAFDFNPDEGWASQFPRPRENGVLTLNMSWDTIFDQNYTLLIYLMWDNIITIDSRRNIILDYIP